MTDIKPSLEVRVAVLEQKQSIFEHTVVEQNQRAAYEDSSIHSRLDELVSEVHKIPEMVSTKLNECRNDMRDEIDKDHPRRHEVVTPRALISAAGLLAVVLVAGMSVTMVVWNKIDYSAHDVVETPYVPTESK